MAKKKIIIKKSTSIALISAALMGLAATPIMAACGGSHGQSQRAQGVRKAAPKAAQPKSMAAPQPAQPEAGPASITAPRPNTATAPPAGGSAVQF